MVSISSAGIERKSVLEYLPRPRIPISGPGGVQTSFNWQAVFDEALEKSVTVTLKNDVATYA